MAKTTTNQFTGPLLKRQPSGDNQHESQPFKRTKLDPNSRTSHAVQEQQTAASHRANPPVKLLQSPPKRMLQLYVCGDGSGGELGLGPGKRVTNVRAPRPNPNLTQVVDIAAGGMHATALTTNNEVLTWGINDLGTLARDTSWEEPVRDMDADDSEEDHDSNFVLLNPFEATPMVVPQDKFAPSSRIVQVSAGDSSTFVLTDQGLVYGWGIFRDGNGAYAFTYEKDRPFKPGDWNVCHEPLLIPGLKDIVHVSAGADFALALDVHGRVYAWGSGQQGELGRRLVERRRHEALLPMLVEIPSRIRIVFVKAAANHAFAVDSNGDTWAWGLNNFGQTGITTGAGQSEAVVLQPRRVPSLTGKRMKMIAGGLHHSIGLTEDGKCLAWGRLDGGQSGLDLQQVMRDDPSNILTDSRHKPRVLLQPKSLPIPKCCYIAAGSDHCLAITVDGHAYSWGLNASYQCGLGHDEDVMVATRLQGKHIKDQKLVWAGAGGQYSMFGSFA